jgi:hypothetical protein
MLIIEGMKLPGIKYYLRLYPCWQQGDCPGCMYQSQLTSCGKPCWREEEAYCKSVGDEDMCHNCEFHGN